MSPSLHNQNETIGRELSEEITQIYIRQRHKLRDPTFPRAEDGYSSSPHPNIIFTGLRRLVMCQNLIVIRAPGGVTLGFFESFLNLPHILVQTCFQ